MTDSPFTRTPSVVLLQKDPNQNLATCVQTHPAIHSFYTHTLTHSPTHPLTHSPNHSPHAHSPAKTSSTHAHAQTRGRARAHTHVYTRTHTHAHTQAHARLENEGCEVPLVMEIISRENDDFRFENVSSQDVPYAFRITQGAFWRPQEMF